MESGQKMESGHSSSHRQHEESVRAVEEIRLGNETIHVRDIQETPSSTYRAQTEASNIRIVTPNYKSGEKPGSDLKTGTTAAELNSKFSETNGDYKAERSQEHFRMQIIDPKVADHAHMPAHAPREYARKKLMDDFPSMHGKRSFLNLDAMEQRKVRQSRPITTSKYLTESVDRHRDMEASELSKYLKAREEDANKPWNKPGWPGPKKNNIDLDQLRQSLDALHKAPVKEPPPPIRYEPPPPMRQELVEVRREVVSKPKVTQTVQRFEENKRTEEVERRVIRRERRHKSTRTRQGHGYHQEYDWHGGGGAGIGYRSTSASRGGGGAYGYTNGYVQPVTYESHHNTSSRRGGAAEHERSSAASDYQRDYQRGMAHARYGSLSDSLRRGDLKYIPNGEVRETNGQNGYSKQTKIHKSHSTRDVFGQEGGGNYGSRHSFDRRGGYLDAPVVEFPPTLPRGGRYGNEPPMPPPHRGGGGDEYYRPITKSRSYADWDQGRGPFGNSVSKYDDDMARLENEFRDARLMRLPDGNMNEKEFRHQEIPGGYESYQRDIKSTGGRKANRDGLPTDFKESSQEYNFKREQQR